MFCCIAFRWGKILVSFCFLLLTFFLLALSPAEAQGFGSSWVADPCDAQGNVLSNPQLDNEGFYIMGGTRSGTLSNTYPAPMIADALARPDEFGFYFGAGDSLGVTDIPSASFPNGTHWGYIGGGSGALNNAGNAHGGGDYTATYWYYIDPFDNSPSIGLINGGVTGHFTGQLVYYFKVTWQGYGEPTSPMPDHISLLLKTVLGTEASVDYKLSKQTSGLSASASAADGPPFNETAMASAGSTGPVNNVVRGYHLVVAAVDPQTGIAETFLNGTADYHASNGVAYGNLDGGPTNGDTSAYASCSTEAMVRQDNRSITISCPAIDTPASYYKGVVDASHPTGQWPHVRSASDGSLQADSVATYTTADWAYGGAWIATATLSANTPGFTNPAYAWSSDFNPAQMVGESLTNQSVNGGWLIGTADKLPVTKTIRVDVQDAPQSPEPATAANTYSIQWHQPFEQWSDCLPPPVEEIDVIPGTPPSGIPLSQLAYTDQVFHCNFSFGPNQMTDGIDTAQRILPITQPFFSPIWQALIGAAGQPYDKALLGVTTSHDVVNDSDAFTEATYLTSIGKGTFVPLDSNNVIGPDSEYAMTAGFLSAHYKKRFLQGDSYDIHGYAGPSPTKTSRTIFKVQATGQYVLVGSIVPIPK